MITVTEATVAVLAHQRDFGTELVPFEQAQGRVLAEELHADRDFPPFNRVMMDGIAINWDAFAKGQRKFEIHGLQAAGSPDQPLTAMDGCLEIMTGAMLSTGADTVIRYEDVAIADGWATIEVENITQGQHIHLQAEDRKTGDLLVAENTVLSPAELGVAATIGREKLLVKKLPRVIVVSTGDELVEVGATPLKHQVRRSNVHTLVALLQQSGIAAETGHLNDKRDEIRAVLSKYLESFDVILMSGGVSKGKLDYVPEILEELQVTKAFHKVRQRPGKPFWFGYLTGKAVVFAFPGNPVSTFMCAKRYFEPWLRNSLGLPPFEHPFAALTTDFYFKPDLQYFLQVKVVYDTSGQLLAEPIVGHGSGDLANLGDADGFLELPQGRDTFNKGEAFPLITYR